MQAERLRLSEPGFLLAAGGITVEWVANISDLLGCSGNAAPSAKAHLERRPVVINCRNLIDLGVIWVIELK